MISARHRAYLMLLIVAVIWGIASPVIKFTLAGFNPVTFLTYRFGISTVFAIIIFLITGWHIPNNKKILWQMILYGFLTSTVSLGFLFFGLKTTTVLDSALITLANPLIISLSGVYFLKEHLTKKEKIGIGIAVIGTILTVIEPLIQNHGNQIKLSGNILILGYVITTAIGAVLAKRLLRENVNPLTMTNFSFIVGFISLLPLFLYTNNNSLITIHSVPTVYHIGVFYMALFSGSLAYYLSNRAQKTIEISEASVFSYLNPVFSMPLAIVWLGEKITPIFIVGAIVIATGVAIAEIKNKR